MRLDGGEIATQQAWTQRITSVAWTQPSGLAFEQLITNGAAYRYQGAKAMVLQYSLEGGVSTVTTEEGSKQPPKTHSSARQTMLVRPQIRHFVIEECNSAPNHLGP